MTNPLQLQIGRLLKDLTEGGRIEIVCPNLETLNPGKLLFYLYNGKDAYVTREIRDVQHKDLIEFGTYHVFEHEMKLQPLLMHMTRTGWLVDVAEIKRMRENILTEINNLQKLLDVGAGKAINVKSPDVKWLLYEKLKLPVTKRTATDNPSADKYVIAELAQKTQNPLLLAILEIRSRRDDIERYLDVRLDADNCWRALFDPTGTRTGRLASRANIYGTGNNLQNIPSRLRRIFVARGGKVLFYADLSQAEARVVAYLARCSALIELFESGADIHSRNAARFFNLNLTDAEIKEKYDALRYAAKRIVHGSNYGMQVDRLIQSANDDARRHGQPHRLNYKVAKTGQDMYFLVYPEIKDIFWREIRDNLYQTRTLNTPFGRKRQFFGRWDEKLLNEAYAYIPQSTIGDLTCKAMIRMWDYDKNKWDLPDGAEILVNGHDSLVGECLEKDVEVCMEKLKWALDIPLNIHGKELRIPSDFKIGYNWSEYDKETNPKGLMKAEKWLNGRRQTAA